MAKVQVNGWVEEKDLPDVTRAKFATLFKHGFCYPNAMSWLDSCDKARWGTPHYPHGEIDKAGRNRYCYGQGGLLNGKQVTIVVTEHPVSTAIGCAKGYWVEEDPQSILNYREPGKTK